MHSVRILHTADWHLGKENSYLGNLSNSRKYEIPVTVKKILSVCEDENVDILLIAGDIFESNRVDSDIIDSVFDSLGQLTRAKVVIALGNHDPLTADSPFKNRTLAPNVFVLPENDSVIDFSELNCRVYGSSFGNVYKTGSERFFITPPDDEKINLMVLHGETKSDLSSQYCSVTKDFIKNSKMDYIALGHNHKRSEIMKLENTYFAYSGCPEGQGFDEDGLKGVYLGDISKSQANLNFVPTAKRTHYQIDVDLGKDIPYLEAVMNAIKEASSNYANDLFRITLIGALNPDEIINTDDLIAQISPQVYFLRVKDRTQIKVDLQLLAKENSLKGHFVQQMLSMMEKCTDSERELYENALQIGLKSFERQVNYGED